MLHFYVNENFITDLYILLVLLISVINFERAFSRNRKIPFYDVWNV